MRCTKASHRSLGPHAAWIPGPPSHDPMCPCGPPLPQPRRVLTGPSVPQTALHTRAGWKVAAGGGKGSLETRGQWGIVAAWQERNPLQATCNLLPALWIVKQEADTDPLTSRERCPFIAAQNLTQCLCSATGKDESVCLAGSVLN